jgi:vacuolar-type H+-ATPase subunit F/Vma7
MTSRIVVVVPPELAPGYRLAGVVVAEVGGPQEAEASLVRLLEEGEGGVIAVYEPYYRALPPSLRSRLEESLAPVVVTVPAGLEGDPKPAHRARLAGLLEQAVGYHITFGGDG